MEEELVGIEKLLAEETSNINITLSQVPPPRTAFIVFETNENTGLAKYHAIVPYFRWTFANNS